MAGLVSPRVKKGSAGRMAAGLTHKPMPEPASTFHGNFSPGSRLRAGATSEWASTRCGGAPWGGEMLRDNARTAALFRFWESVEACPRPRVANLMAVVTQVNALS